MVIYIYVSTHSRAEAAAIIAVIFYFLDICFNTQPRGGGCACRKNTKKIILGFQHTAARRRLLNSPSFVIFTKCFNTQPRGGGCAIMRCRGFYIFSFNTQPRGGGCLPPCFDRVEKMGFNTQPRGGGCTYLGRRSTIFRVSTHSRAEAAASIKPIKFAPFMFQHTAARRRLRYSRSELIAMWQVSTHSRAEAAASMPCPDDTDRCGFNTQPRGGGCLFIKFI